MLYLTPLERALDRLKEGWTRHLAQPDDEQLRDGLLKSAWPQWSVFRKMRNLTSHTYNEMTAKQVVATIPDFIAETEFLLATLKERTA